MFKYKHKNLNFIFSCYVFCTYPKLYEESSHQQKEYKNKIINHPVSNQRKKKKNYTSASILHSFLLNLEAQFSKGSRRWRPNPLFVIHLLHPPKCRCGATHTIFYIFSCQSNFGVYMCMLYTYKCSYYIRT